MICLNFFTGRALFRFYWFRRHGMWALSLQVLWLGFELNNNHVWTLTERVR